MRTFTDVIEVVPTAVPVVIAAAIMSIIVIIPVRMITYVVMPVVRPPWIPVRWVVVPVP